MSNHPDYSDDEDEIFIPKHSTPIQNPTKTVLTPEDISTAKTINLHEPTQKDIDEYFFGLNGLIPLSQISKKGIGIQTFDSFHQTTAQVKFNANDSISYRGQARMLDTGSHVSEKVQSAGLELRQLVEDTRQTQKKMQAKQNSAPMRVEYEHILMQLEENRNDGRLSREEGQKLKEKRDQLKIMIRKVDEYLA